MKIYATYQTRDMTRECEVECDDIHEAIRLADGAIEDGGIGCVDVILHSYESHDPVYYSLCDIYYEVVDAEQPTMYPDNTSKGRIMGTQLFIEGKFMFAAGFVCGADVINQDGEEILLPYWKSPHGETIGSYTTDALCIDWNAWGSNRKRFTPLLEQYNLLGKGGLS